MPSAPTRYFARNELSRLCMDALRAVNGASITTDEIAGRLIDAKGFDPADTVLRKAISEQALTIMRLFRKAWHGRADRAGAWRKVEVEVGERGLACQFY
jgi:hypothetical protein